MENIILQFIITPLALFVLWLLKDQKETIRIVIITTIIPYTIAVLLALFISVTIVLLFVIIASFYNLLPPILINLKYIFVYLIASFCVFSYLMISKTALLLKFQKFDKEVKEVRIDILSLFEDVKVSQAESKAIEADFLELKKEMKNRLAKGELTIK